MSSVSQPLVALATSEPTTVLIVDDDPSAHDLLAALLSPQGYRLTFASSGPEALELASTRLPDLVLLDVMMPGMNGFEVCRRLRAHPLLREVPVIVLTTLDDRDSRLRAIEAGADDFISKPFDRLELSGRVRTIARLNRYRRLLAERAKFARAIDLAPDGVLILDGAGLITLANPAIVRLLDVRSEDHLIGQHIAVFVVPERRESCLTCLHSAMDDPTSVARFETMLVRRDGTRLPVEMHAGSFAWDGQPAVQIMTRDISERKRAELLEEERRTIAYELHDGLAQIVTSAHQHMQAFAGRYRPRSPQARRDLDQALDLARRAVQEVRRVIAGLRPTALDDFGLSAALQMHVAAMRAEGWEITCHDTLGDARLAPTIETVIFRVALEALANVRKHAETRRARLELRREGQTLRLIVEDQGRGFDPAALTSRPGLGERIGLRGMRERVALLGGQCIIDSRPDGGTRVIATVPLPGESER